jgi:GT2 family glycosyltransferase
MQAGYKIAYCPNAVVAHIHEENYMQIFNRYRREALALKTIFPNEKFSLVDFLRLFFFNIASDYLFAIRSGRLLTSWCNIPAFRLVQFWGTYRGYQETGRISEQLKHRLYYPKQKSPVIQSRRKIQKRETLLIDYSTKERSYRENR